MKDFQISPDSVRSEPSNPNWTTPRTFGVWELPPGSRGKRYRFGNNPVRGVELAHEYNRAILIALYRSREQARKYADTLNR